MLLRNQNQAQKTLISELETVYETTKNNYVNGKSIISNLEEQVRCSKSAIEEETKRFQQLKGKVEEQEQELFLSKRKLNCGELVSKAYIQENEDLKCRLKVYSPYNNFRQRKNTLTIN